MKIGGLLKVSTIDFPGTISCMIFTSGCNFSCPYCHNPELVRSKVIFKENIFDFLKKRKSVLDGVVISGGEPTLQRDLKDFCFKVKELGYKIKLDTNGSNPEVLKNLYKENLIDYTAMDIKTNLKQYFMIVMKSFNEKLIQESIDIIKERSPQFEFRTTCVKPFIDENIIFNICEMIQGTDKYFLQQCSQDVNMLNPDFFTKDSFFSDKELKGFKEIAEMFIMHCFIR